MSRRRLIAIGSAGLLLALLVVAALLVVTVTQTGFGRERIREMLASRIAATAKGHWHLGEVSGGLFTGFYIDSLEIRDEFDSLFVATGPIRAFYDLRDILDRRILISRIEIDRLDLRITEYGEGDWNYDRLFPPARPSGPVSLERRFGDFIRADTVVVRDGNFVLKELWRPDTLLRGARRDSAIAYNLARTDIDVARVGDTLVRTRYWDKLEVTTAVRWTHPDTTGRYFNVASLDGHSFDPPLDVRNLAGTVNVVSDSIWLDIRSFDLPSSRGSLEGKVITARDGPTLYDIRIQSDSVALSDVNWVYEPLPVEGSGRVDIAIRNNRSNPRIIEYELSNMDLRSMSSHLRGAMTFGVGGPILRLTEMDVDATPLDFKLVERLGGAPFPVPWRGQFTGRVRARGGPVNRFVVDQTNFTFSDANVPLALSSGTASGEIDLTSPSEAIFRGFDVNFAQLDLRTVEFLFPEFPRVGGAASGYAHLDSLWRDVRFSDADFELKRGPATPSRFTGSGRITQAEPFIVFDVALRAQPISFGAFALAFPGFPLRGEMSGPMSISGTMDRLRVSTALSGSAGAFSYDGIIDYALPSYGATGTGTTRSLNMGGLLDRPDLNGVILSSDWRAALSGDSLDNLRGDLTVRNLPSQVNTLRLLPGALQLRFAAGRMFVDSARLVSSAGTLRASGALGLTRVRADSLTFAAHLDSLPALASLLAAANERAAGGGTPASRPLRGTFEVNGVATGSLKTLSLSGSATGSDVRFGPARSPNLRADFSLAGIVEQKITGQVDAEFDTLGALGVTLADASASVQLSNNVVSHFAAQGTGRDGSYAAVRGHGEQLGDQLRVTLDSLTVELATNIWSLASEGRVTSTADGWTVDRLELAGDAGSRISLTGAVPARGNIDLRLVASRLPLLDVARTARIRTALQGNAAVELLIGGTRDAPTISLEVDADSVGVAGTRLESATATVRFSQGRLDADVGLFFGGARAVSVVAQLPVELDMASGLARIVDAPMSGRVSVNGVDLSIVETMIPQVTQAAGRLSSQIGIGGTWSQPRLTGSINVSEGRALLRDIGLELEHINSDIVLSGDSAVFRRLSTAYRGGEAGDTASVSGSIGFSNFLNPTLNLNFVAHNFNAVKLTRVADLYVNTQLFLTGTLKASSLSGTASVDRGALFIPELAQKRLIELNLDTSIVARRELAAPVPNAILENLELRNVRVVVGDQVWLRSAEGSTNIQLGGEVSMTSVRVPRTGEVREGSRAARTSADSVYRLALEGTLSADRGDYRLDAGVVQRKFQVESGGTVSFYGEPELNPSLDISAVHSVRRLSGQDAGRDIRIRVRLTGSLSDYQISLESADGLDLPESELFSYLVTGSPSFELGAAGNEHLRTAAAILLPSLVARIGDRIAGGNFDVFRLEMAPLGDNERLGGTLSDVFKRTQLGVGKQLGTRTFVLANTSFCQLGSLLEGKSSTTEELIQSIGVKLEHRLNHNFSLAVSAEPSTAATRCSAVGTSPRGLVSSPLQLGFDILKIWRF